MSGMVNIGKPFQRDGRSRKWEAEGTRRQEGVEEGLISCIV